MSDTGDSIKSVEFDEYSQYNTQLKTWSKTEQLIYRILAWISNWKKCEPLKTRKNMIFEFHIHLNPPQLN